MSLRPSWLLRGVLAAALVAGACSVYDESLLLPEEDDDAGGSGPGAGGAQGGQGGQGARGGDGGAQAGGASSGGRGGGGSGGCSGPADCPGPDTDCQSPTCEAGLCDISLEPMGAACSEGGGKKCDGRGACVECLVDGDCTSMVCAPDHSCAPAQCGDDIENGTETDVDCGGATCPPCATGKKCDQDDDCVGGTCSGMGICAPTCTDGVENQNEGDVDCGGPCADCAIGQSCNVAGDCVSASCVGMVCACAGTQLVISEIRTRGPGGGNDEFVELYNPTNAAVVLDASWKIESRSASAMTYQPRWIGAGASIPSHGHFLIAGTAYAQMPMGDALLSSGISDAASVRLVHSVTTVDAVCFYFNAATLTTLTTTPGYECEGAPVSNLPHNDGSSAASNSDVSLERKPGGAAGNCTDTGDSTADFQTTMPAAPQNVASPPT